MNTLSGSRCPVVRVTHEWARLREVIVGRPFYRLPKPFPEERKAHVSPELWAKVKAREGMTMQRAMPSEHARCAEQMDSVAALLKSRGIRVHRVPAFSGHEEDYLRERFSESLLFFPRDPLLVAGERVIELSVRDRRRRRERYPLRRLLERRGAATQLLSMPEPEPADSAADPWPFVEGGDCLVNGGEIYVGMREGSTNPEGIAWLQAALGTDWRVTPVALSPEFAHLDCTLCLVRPGLGLVCREGLPEGLPAALAGWHWIEVPLAEAQQHMATNGLQLDAGCIVLPAAARMTTRALRRAGQQVETLPFDTVTAFGGGMRCWSQPLARWD